MTKLINRYKRHIIFIAILISVAGLIYYAAKNTNNFNIYGDMYSHLKRGPNSTFASKLGGGVDYRNYRNPTYDKGVFGYGSVNNELNDVLPDNVERLGLWVNSKHSSQALKIGYDYKVASDLILTVTFIYDADKEQLSETIRVKNGNKGRLKEVLTSKNMTESDLQKETQTMVNKTVIHAWLEIHPSRFSEKDWGKISIKTPQIFDRFEPTS